MKVSSFCRPVAALALAASVISPSPARAEQFTDGSTAFHLWTVPGVVRRNGLVTEVLCTNIGLAPVNIGVRFFDQQGSPINDFGAPPAPGACNGSMLGVPSYGTVSIANSGTAQLHEDCIVSMGALLNGSAKIFSNGKTIACSAFALDRDNAIEDPVSGLPTGVSPTIATLKVVKSRKQNGD